VIASYDLLGSKITPATAAELCDLIDGHVAAERPCVVASQNLHGMYVALHDPAVRRLHEGDATYVHIDGMPIVWLCRLAGIRASAEHRVTLLDLIWPLLERAEQQGRRVYALGGTDLVASAAAKAIAGRLPRLALRAHHGFFDDGAETQAVLEDIRAFQTDIVLVGLGMGRQERWILDHAPSIAPACIVTVGACMEYLGGAVKTPPRWLGPLGLEWLFRFAENPKRFWRRYLLEPWVVAFALAGHLARRRSGFADARFKEEAAAQVNRLE
jgi:N-acetylglucosaminyldiphosphoundecaprenol N-acetyl-beta-D-mannosaminyltransferase